MCVTSKVSPASLSTYLLIEKIYCVWLNENTAPGDQTGEI